MNMTIIYRPSIFKALLIALAFNIFFGIDNAQALTFSPAIKEYNSYQGDTITETLRLYNDNDTDKIFYPIYYDFTAPTDESGTPMFSQQGTLATSSSLASWFRRLPPVVIKAKEKQEVIMHIDIPKDAEPGGHYGALLFSDQPTTDANIGVGSQTGPLILVNIFGDIKEDLSIKTFDSATFSASTPLAFILRLDNKGSVHETPTGQIRITGWWPSETVIPVNQQKLSHVLPKSIRKLTYYWGDQNAKSTGFFDKVKYEWKNFAFGRFTAEISLTYGMQDEKSVAASTKFWLIPYHLLTVVVGFLIVMFGLLKLYTGYIIRKTQRSESKHKKR